MLSINKNKISENHTPYLIVEACINHQGDFNMAKKMIFYAKKSGAQCIKFQHHIIDEEMIRDVPMSSNFKEPLDIVIEKTNFTLNQHKSLKEYCRQLNIDYLCTPFSIKAAEELNSIGVKAFKTGSGELTNLPFIDYLAKIGKPVILSTGMSYPDEIEESIKILKKNKTPFAIMHCISAYPCPYNIMNLDNITELKKKYKVPIGLSDHTPSIYNALGAVSLGASLIEKHFTFNKKLKGPDHKSSIDLPELKMLVQGCKANFLSRGKLKKIFDEEKEIAAWARESVVSKRYIKKGELITKFNICTKRPTAKKNEISAYDYFKLIKSKKTAAKNIFENQKIKKSDLLK
jgi:sialic acid synthase SpsE